MNTVMNKNVIQAVCMRFMDAFKRFTLEKKGNNVVVKKTAAIVHYCSYNEMKGSQS